LEGIAVGLGILDDVGLYVRVLIAVFVGMRVGSSFADTRSIGVSVLFAADFFFRSLFEILIESQKNIRLNL